VPTPPDHDLLRVSSASPFEKEIGFSRAVAFENRILVSGTAPIRPDGTCHPDPETQAARCLEIIGNTLMEAGSNLSQVVRTRMFLICREDASAVGRAHRHVFGAFPPAATMVIVQGLLDPQWKVEIEAEARRAP